MNLYFSLKCKFSKQLISIIQKNDEISNKMKAVCVDDEPFPPSVTHVPTLEFDGKTYVGKRAFDHVSSLCAPKPPPSLQGMELGSGFTFIENGSQNFRFDGGISSSDISENVDERSMSSRFDIANGRESDKKASVDLMDQLKAQREKELPAQSKRV